ncbi:UvrD-helicase domain-containing protein [[Actinomadura] parvosata]|uniref:UvrD-helicase domain-containing protein n=1 Tax=[Actinomadura] parvosata TaxID=1955412 RepID=UPI00406D310D
MLPLPCDQDALSAEQIIRMAAALGLEVSHEQQTAFLQSASSLDLQAAPGSGKTSLLALKLALLANSWSSPGQGVCVMSHTNTATEEIADRLRTSPRGKEFLKFPHFIGTIQSFTHTFVAMPALRAAQIQVRSFDDHQHARAAQRLLTVGGFRFSTVRRWLSTTYSYDPLAVFRTMHYVFHDDELALDTPTGLRLGHDTESYKQLLKIKHRLAQMGYFRYADMFAIAERHLHNNPQVGAALRRRFPFVLLDEMQDTSSAQERLLNRVFPAGDVIVQRVGDINQRIYSPDTRKTAARASSFPQPHAMELSTSRRFGPQIAAVASALTVHRRQRIEGGGPDGDLALMIYDDSSVGSVVSAFERLAAQRIPHTTLHHRPPRVLGARSSKGTTHRRPQSIDCYLPGYARASTPATTASFLHQARQAQKLWQGPGESAQAVQALLTATRSLLDVTEINLQAQDQAIPHLSGLSRDPRHPHGRLRRAFLDILEGNLTDPAIWHALTGPLIATMDELCGGLGQSRNAITELLAFHDIDPNGEINTHDNGPTASTMITAIPGTIHNAKGETHAATLILECLDKSGHIYDVHEVLTLLAHGRPPAEASPRVRDTAQLLFVAVTRPTHLLAMAIHHDRAQPLLPALVSQGWQVHEVNDEPGYAHH